MEISYMLSLVTAHLFILIVYLLELEELNCEWHGFYWKDILFKII